MKESVIPTLSSEPKFSHSRKSKRLDNEQESSRRVHSGPKERTHPSEADYMKRSNSSGDITPRNDPVSPTHRSPNKHDSKSRNSTSQSSRSTSQSSSRRGSAGRDKDSIYFEDNIQPLLKQIELNFLHEDMEALVVNLDMLWRYLESGKMLGKQTGSLAARRRSLIMNTLYKLTAAVDSIVLMKMSRLAIAVSEPQWLK